ncbi:unnamed protein product [Cylindrotheca closterium]|uniref:carnosine N-methyltransferase n=1 Tax=Cylindrotheca closterium TaxID=2856 RepID=A0AAD2CKK0_9STRA|nr:unnamed protein product [Cylindrotheca closterium]
MSQKDGVKKHELHALSGAYDTYLEHDESEKNHFDDVCRAFRQHATFVMSQWANHQFRLHALPQSQRDLLPDALKHGTPDFNKRASHYKDAAIRNQFCFDCMLRHAGVPHSQQQVTPITKVPSDEQMSKITSVLKSLARDWSAEGKRERDMAYVPIIEQIKKYMPLSDLLPHDRPTIAVPGAGVGRLAFELTKLGYAVQGNEFSLYMLLASDFMLNGGIATPDRPLRISPWILESRNSHSSADRCRSIPIPDVDPTTLLNSGGNAMPPIFSMAAGDFVSIYSNPSEAGKWDCVCSCFFMDACPNIVEILQIIHKMLKPGGYLMNFGPLLYHWSGPPMRPDDESPDAYHSRFQHLDDRYLKSVDLSYEDVKETMMKVGFEVVEEHVGMESLYTADERSMQSTMYNCVNFVARKRRSEYVKQEL